jgi:hypothetical protein
VYQRQPDGTFQKTDDFVTSARDVLEIRIERDRMLYVRRDGTVALTRMRRPQ